MPCLSPAVLLLFLPWSSQSIAGLLGETPTWQPYLPCLTALLHRECESKPRLVTVASSAPGEWTRMLAQFVHTASPGPVIMWSHNRDVSFDYPLDPMQYSNGVFYNKNEWIILIVGKVFDDDIAQNIAQLKKLSFWYPQAQFLVILTTDEELINKELESMYKIFWKEKIVNVIVVYWIRKYIMNRNQDSCENFIVTTYSPYVNKDNPSKVVDIPIHRRRNEKLFTFNGVQNNLYGYPVRLSMMPSEPSMMLVNSSDGRRTVLRGQDGLLWEAILHQMNASFEVSEPKDRLPHGFLVKNNTFNGAIGEVAYGRADVATNSWIINPEWRYLLEFTYPHSKDNYCILVRKAERVPYYEILSLPFSTMCWFLICISIPLSTITKYFLQHKKRSNHIFQECTHCFFETVHMLIYGSYISIRRENTPEKLLNVILCFASVILTYAYQGQMISFFTVPKYKSDIRTLQQVHAKCDVIYTYPYFSRFFSEMKDDDLIQELSTKFRDALMEDEWNSAIGNVSSGKGFAAMMKESEAKHRMGLTLNKISGSPKLHLVKECALSPAYVSFVVNRNSPFISTLNHLILKAAAAGLIEKWQRDTNYEFILQGKTLLSNSVQRRPLTIVDFEGAFLVYVIGIGVSTMIYITEQVLWSVFNGQWPG